MSTGKLVFAQLTAHLPLTAFRRCVARYKGDHKIKTFTCLEQLLVMIFAQLIFRTSLRGIEACFRAQPAKLYHMGVRSHVARNTLVNANVVRDQRIFTEFVQRLIAMARKLAANEALGVALSSTIYALDSTTSVVMRKSLYTSQTAFFLRLRTVQPGWICSNRRRQRSILARMSSARACQMKGLGSRFQVAMNSSIAPTKSGMLAKLPRRTALPVKSPNQRSTILSQLELVGMKCTLNRGCRANQRCTCGVL